VPLPNLCSCASTPAPGEVRGGHWAAVELAGQCVEHVGGHRGITERLPAGTPWPSRWAPVARPRPARLRSRSGSASCAAQPWEPAQQGRPARGLDPAGGPWRRAKARRSYPAAQRGRGRGHRRRVGRALGGSPAPDLPSLGWRPGRGP